MKKRMMALLLSAALIASFGFSSSVFALEEEEDGSVSGSSVPAAEETVDSTVAEIDRAELAEPLKFDSLEEAVKNSLDGDVIRIVKDCSVGGEYNVTFNHNVTVNGGNKQVDFGAVGIKVNAGKTVTLNDCNWNLHKGADKEETPWIVCGVCKDAVFDIKNSNLELSADGVASDTTHGIYVSGASEINLDASKITISGYHEDAIEWDGGSGYMINLKNQSVLDLSNCRAGITGSFNVESDNSTINIHENRGNGSNGSNFVFKNSSDVSFSNNGGYGLSAGNVEVSASTVQTNENGYTGFIARSIVIDKASKVTVKHNNLSGANGGLRVFGSTGNCLIEEGADVDISENYRSGIFVDNSEGVMVMNSGRVTGNGIGGDICEAGGGVYNVGSFTMGGSAVVYNNHAALTGDDIYSTGKITLMNLKDKNLTLSDDDNKITGWFFDGLVGKPYSGEKRWNVKATTGKDSIEDYYEEYTVKEDDNAAVALKAAHPYIYVPPYVPPAPDPVDPSVDPADDPVTPDNPPEIVDPSENEEADPGEDVVKPTKPVNHNVGENSQNKIEDKSDNNEAPQTGDETNILFWFGIAIAATLALLLRIRTKRN